MMSKEDIYRKVELQIDYLNKKIIDAKMKEIIDVVEDESGKTASGNVSIAGGMIKIG